MRSRLHMVSMLSATAMAASILNEGVYGTPGRSMVVTNKAKCPADSAERIAKAEAKRARKAAARLALRR